MKQREFLGETSFAVTARVALQLGRESISSSIVAILELVKNAYDADAENVLISFIGLGTPEALLVIDDDGTGMSLDQLENSWMVIGTDSKRSFARSVRKNRVLTGEKGLGRLGLDRLCEVTQVQTFTENEQFGVELEIDWRKYEESSQRLESIAHKLYSIPKTWVSPVARPDDTEYKSKGTRLILRGLKDNWDLQTLVRLHKELALLVSPFGDVNDFSIFLDSGKNYGEVDGRLSSADGLAAAEWKVISKIYQEDGNYFVSHEMTSPVHSAVFRFDPTPWIEVIKDTPSNGPRCGPLTFELYFVPRDPIEGISLSRSQIDTFLDANQGVRIYRDGFRVKPYGDPSGEGDWLSLSIRRIQSPAGVKRRPLGSWRVGYNQVVGAVFISREANAELLDQTNREGIVEGAPFFDLRRFALHAVTFFERSRQTFAIARDEVDPYDKAKTAAESASDASLAAVEQLKSAVNEVTSRLKTSDTQSEVDAAYEVIDGLTSLIDNAIEATRTSQEAQGSLLRATEEREEELQRQKDTMGNLASLGILAAAFGHETLGAAILVQNNVNLLRRNIGNLLFAQPDVHNNILNNVDDIGYGADKIETFAKFALANVSKDKRKRSKVNLDVLAEEVLEYFSKMFKDEAHISVLKDFAADIPPILAFRIDWESIIVNLITNAVWAMENTPAPRRAIRIRIFREDGILHFAFSDSGCGLEAGIHDMIFVPTFSTKRNERGDVIGTGMGLAIVKNLVETGHGGTIDVVSPSDLGGAEFHIRIPIPKLENRGKGKHESKGNLVD